jgi:hypothetical protein
VKQFLVPDPKPYEVSFETFSEEFNVARRNPVLLNQFTKDHVGQQVKWDAIIRGIDSVASDEKRPAYWIAPSLDTKMPDYVYATFEKEDFEGSIPIGTRIEITGIFDEGTNITHAFLDDCKFSRK